MSDAVDPEYQGKIEDIKIKSENLSEDGMKSVYKKQKASLNELQSWLGNMFVEYDTENGLLKLTRQQQSKLSIEMKDKLKEMGIILAQSEVGAVSTILGEVYATTYYMNAWVLDGGITAALKFHILKPEVINKAVNTVYEKELFSDRIYKNKGLMIDSLQKSLIRAFKGEISIDKIGREIKNTFNVSAYESKRLVVTEAARIQTQATDDIAKSTGIKKQMYSATLDKKTNPKDASFDQKIYDVNDPNKPKIPQHPNCRCCYINIPYAGWSSSERKDNVTGKLIPNQDYATWLKDKGINNPKNSNPNGGNHDIIDKESLLPNLEKAHIPDSKVRVYALEQDVDKATAFKNALGYDPSNADELISNIYNNIPNFKATVKDETKYGKRFEVIMKLSGVNAKEANVLTAWMVKNGDDFPSLTSLYVTKKKVK